jgi:XRE family transcriptional regulator, fatty acid utilization regulator
LRKPTLTGSRIRANRLDRGIRQADLARRCDISPSYLNLIEHNRRSIGGALLNRIASALAVDPGILSEGAEAALTTALGAAADSHRAAAAEVARAEEFAGRFPGWARLIDMQYRELRRLELVVEALNDRLTHDPFMSASMHEILSSVTAIRSTSAILADGGEIEAEWQARFHRNLYEDSQRLAQSTEALVSYLDAGGDADRGVSLPQDDVEAWLADRDWWLEEVEADPSVDTDVVLAGAAHLTSPSARQLAGSFVRQYAADAGRVGRGDLCAAIAGDGADPARLAHRFGVDLPTMLRRLATLGAGDFPDGQPRGLVVCDASGTLLFRKPVPGFDLPRYGAACPLWPLFQALQRPVFLVRQTLLMAGRDGHHFESWAVSETRHPAGFEGPAVVEAWMLVVPALRPDARDRPEMVGTSCRICAHDTCPARREPSIMATAVALEGEGARLL